MLAATSIDKFVEIYIHVCILADDTDCAGGTFVGPPCPSMLLRDFPLIKRAKQMMQALRHSRYLKCGDTRNGSVASVVQAIVLACA